MKAQQADLLWKRGEMIAGWENERRGVIAPSVPMRGFKLVDGVLVACSFEEMARFLYAIEKTGGSVKEK